MLKFLLFTKKTTGQNTPRLFEWNYSGEKKLPYELIQQGTLCLTKGIDFETIRQLCVKEGFCYCGEKKEKIELRRALKFDEKRDRDKPKLLIFNSTGIGAFKRGLNTFYEGHFSANDPSCIIIIPDSIFETLMREGVIKSRKSKKLPGLKQDNIFELMDVPETSPVMDKLKLSYIGDSTEVKHTRALIYKASLTDSPVLILGETGTGKDVIASKIYENSNNHNKVFIRVNCSALTETIFESEMFGHVAGSYTDAKKDKKGLFEEADNGTIFLDEIGDLSLSNQVKILHVVENQEIRRVGSNTPKKINVRVIAATNRNLYAMMRQGTFRDDLYYRINTILIKASPLREHPDDIADLAKAYWEKKNRKSKLTPKFLDYLKTYSWPGNVRELNALLNSLADYYSDASPTPQHVEYIRKWRQDELIQAKNIENDDPSRLLKIKSQTVLIEVQNILRLIKTELLKEINSQTGAETRTDIDGRLKTNISGLIVKLNKLCLEPGCFIRWELFKLTEKYIQVLDEMQKNWPESRKQLLAVWKEKLQKPDDEINQGIMELVWGKIDM